MEGMTMKVSPAAGDEHSDAKDDADGSRKHDDTHKSTITRKLMKTLNP